MPGFSFWRRNIDRAIVYPGQQPLDTDILSTNRNALIALGYLAQELMGQATLAAGFTCGATGPASLNVLVGPGRLYSYQNVDGTAYGSLPANTANQLLKQGISLSSVQLATPAPISSGQSINYLVEVAFQESDTSLTTLQYFDSANPNLPYSGPSNSGAQQATVRQDLVAVQIKAGASATTGTQTTPAADAGFTGLFVVTVAFGQTTVTAANISTLPSAPLIGGAQPYGSSPLVAPASSPVVGVFADLASTFHNGTTASFTYTLPQISLMPPGWRSPMFATVQAGVITLSPNAADKIGTKTTGQTLASSSANGNTIRLRVGPSSTWLIESQLGTWS